MDLCNFMYNWPHSFNTFAIELYLVDNEYLLHDLYKFNHSPIALAMDLSIYLLHCRYFSKGKTNKSKA
jgi:hypothetical protein